MDIKRPKNLSDFHVDRIIEDAIDQLGRVRKNGLGAQVAKLVSNRNYDNKEADEFFEVMAIVMGFFDDRSQEDNIDMFASGRSSEKAYTEAFDNAFTAAIAYVAMGDEYIMEDCDRDEARDIKENVEAFNDIKHAGQSLVRYVPDDRGGRDSRRDRDYDRDDRGSRRDRSDRSSRRDRDDRGSRRERYERDDRRSRRRGSDDESLYSHRARQTRDTQAPEPSSRSERLEKRASKKLVEAVRAYIGSPNRMPVVKDGGMPSLMKKSVSGVLAVEILDNGTVSHVYDKENNVEPYAQHELRAFVNADRDSIIVPTVDFRVTPELVDQTAVANNNKVYVSPDIQTFNRHGWCNVNIQSVMASNVDKRAQMLVQTIGQLRDMCVTRPVYDKIIGAQPVSFDEWHKILMACRSELVRANASVATENSEFSPSDIERMIYTIGRLEDDLLFLLIQFMSVILPADSNFTTTSFIRAWPDLSEAIRTWVSDEKHDYHDCGNEFYRLEREYLVSNYRVSDTSINEGAATATVIVESKAVCVYYRGAVFNLDTNLDVYGQYFQIEHKNLPELFTACSRLLRYRNSRHGLANIYIFDSTGARLILTGGDLDGGRCCMVRPHGEDQPFAVV